MRLTPGICFILQRAPLASIPVIVYHILKRTNVPIPRPASTTLSLFLVPLWFALKITLREWKNRRAAARVGARLPPRLKGKYPGNLDVLNILMEDFREGYPGDLMGEYVAEQGHIADLWILWESQVLTTEPSHIKQMLSTEFHNFIKGPRFQLAMSSVLGTGVFNADGDMWKFHRAMTRPFFTRDRISHFELFDKHASEVIAKMKARLREGYSVDFQDAMYRFTLDSATDYLFGSSVNSASSTFPYPHYASAVLSLARLTSPADEFAESFKNAQFIIAARERYGWSWPLREIFEVKSDKDMKVVNSYVEPIIRQALENRSISKGEGQKDNETLLEHLIDESTDPTILRDETINIMIAGRDTTAGTLTFIFYFLAKYPKVFERLREEILKQVGPTAMPTYDDVREMKYLRAVINETLRLYPVVPFNTRQSINATTFPSPDPSKPPLFIPANTKVPYSVFLMHRRKDLWGPDAEDFDPDRFLNTDPRLKKYLLANSFIFLPFNAGPRICLGQQARQLSSSETGLRRVQFAYNEMSFMIVRLIQNFSEFILDMNAHPPNERPPKKWAADAASFGLRKGIDELNPRVHITMYNLGGLWLNMKEAKVDSEKPMPA